MGAVGLNGAAATVKDPKERIPVAAVGWKRWAPVQMAAFIAHGVGGAGLILGNKARLAGQPEARTNTTVKLTLTLVAVGSSVYSGFLGARMAAHAGEEPEALPGRRQIRDRSWHPRKRSSVFCSGLRQRSPSDCSFWQLSRASSSVRLQAG